MYLPSLAVSLYTRYWPEGTEGRVSKTIGASLGVESGLSVAGVELDAGVETGVVIEVGDNAKMEAFGISVFSMVLDGSVQLENVNATEAINKMIT